MAILIKLFVKNFNESSILRLLLDLTKKSFFLGCFLVAALVFSSCSKEVTIQNGEPENETEIFKRDIVILDRENAIKELPEIEEWETFFDEQNGYLLMHPKDFLIKNDNYLVNFEAIDEEEEVDEDYAAEIEIKKRSLDSEFENFGQLEKHFLETKNDLTEPATEVQLGDYVVLKQYFEYGPSGQQYNLFISYAVEENEYYEIKILEPGYSENQEEIERVMETFTLFE